MVRRYAQIQEASQWGKQASKRLHGCFKRGVSDISDSLKSSGTVLLVSLLIASKAVLLMGMWLGYLSTITWWIITLQPLWPIESVQAAAPLQISHCEDRMYWLDGYSTIWDVGAYFSGSWDGGQMSDNLDFFGEVLGLILVFCLFHYYIIHIHAWRAVLRVHDVVINRWDVYFWDRHSGSNRTLFMTIMLLVVRYLCSAAVSVND